MGVDRGATEGTQVTGGKAEVKKTNRIWTDEEGRDEGMERAHVCYSAEG